MSTNAGGGRPARLLVVDDDEHITAFLRRALAYEGFGVETAADGEAGLAAARDRPPDLVVLDLMLPGLDGVEVLRRLRAGEDEAGRLPILLLTARDGVSDRVAGLDAGADDYLVKPFALEELTARLRVLLRRREPQARRVLRFADLIADTASREVRRGGGDPAHRPGVRSAGRLHAPPPAGADPRAAPGAGVGDRLRGRDARPGGLRRLPARQARSAAGRRRRPA